MSYASHDWLFLLLLIIPLAALLAWWALWRSNAQRRLGARADAMPRWLALGLPVMTLLAFAIVVVAAARPQIGHRNVKTEDKGIDIAIVLDVSQSMTSTDADPSRLGRAQVELAALLDRLQGDRAGLIIFGKTAFVRSPLTSDVSAVHKLVDGVDRERGLVEPGSDLGSAVRAGTRMLSGSETRTKVMLIVSDGEDHGTTVSQSIASAKQAGVLVYTAGAGTTQGTAVLDPDPLTGDPLPRAGPNGQPIITKLDPAALQAMATAGGGRYVEMSGDGRPLSVLASEFSSLAPTTFGVRQTSDRIDRFQIFAGIALALLMVEALLPWALRQRRREVTRLARRAVPLAAGGLFAGAICSGGIAAINRAGNRHYDAGEYDAAITQYQRALAMDPSHTELHNNIGNALDQQGQYDNASDEAKQALPAKSDDLTDKIEYSIGNHEAGGNQLQDALEAYKRALLAKPNDADAKHNLELIQSRLNASTTPSPSPTPTPSEESAQGTGTPGANGTPEPGGTPNSQGTPNPFGPTPSDANQSLDEALKGIDKQFTEEEAIRVLDLIDQANQQDLGSRPAPRGSLPDY